MSVRFQSVCHERLYVWYKQKWALLNTYATKARQLTLAYSKWSLLGSRTQYPHCMEWLKVRDAKLIVRILRANKNIQCKGISEDNAANVDISLLALPEVTCKRLVYVGRVHCKFIHSSWPVSGDTFWDHPIIITNKCPTDHYVFIKHTRLQCLKADSGFCPMACWVNGDK